MSTCLSLRAVARLTGAAFCALLAAAAWRPIPAQQQQPQQKPMSSLTRGRVESMLGEMRNELKKNYYDPAYHGLDLDARYKEYEERLKHVPTMGESFRLIAAYVAGLNDSHTFFEPPRRSYRFDYGYQMEIVGDQCFITDVRPGSDAEKKIHPGDQVLMLGRYSLNRKDLWQLEYYLNQLAPTPATDFTLRDPAGNTRKEQVLTKYLVKNRLKDATVQSGYSAIWDLVLEEEQERHLLRHRYIQSGDVLFWKMPMFIDDEAALAAMVDMARKHKALILDLRGNPGGHAAALQFVVGSFFDHDVKIATQIMRKDRKELVAKSRGHDAFIGQLFVLVDSRSASASELFARTVQLEHRGTVVGDLTSGSVMAAIYRPLQIGMQELGGLDWDEANRTGGINSPDRVCSNSDIVLFYGASITEADLVMTDGKSLEKVGVTPDVVVLPTAEDLAAGRDPVLAKAAELAGIKLAPAAAGKMFPFEWTPF